MHNAINLIPANVLRSIEAIQFIYHNNSLTGFHIKWKLDGNDLIKLEKWTLVISSPRYTAPVHLSEPQMNYK